MFSLRLQERQGRMGSFFFMTSPFFSEVPVAPEAAGSRPSTQWGEIHRTAPTQRLNVDRGRDRDGVEAVQAASVLCEDAETFSLQCHLSPAAPQQHQQARLDQNEGKSLRSCWCVEGSLNEGMSRRRKKSEIGFKSCEFKQLVSQCSERRARPQ